MQYEFCAVHTMQWHEFRRDVYMWQSHVEIICRVFAKLPLRLRDTVWSMFLTPYAITRTAQLHQTKATKDGAQIGRRDLVHTHSQKE